jgi:hypothetical protein
MDLSRYRWKSRLFIVLVAGLAALVWTFTRQGQQEPLVIENQSGVPIVVLQVTVDGDTKSYHDVPALGTVTTSMEVKPDAKGKVEGKLADGSLLRSSFSGSAASEGAHLVILPKGDITFKKPGKER